MLDASVVHSFATSAVNAAGVDNSAIGCFFSCVVQRHSGQLLVSGMRLTQASYTLTRALRRVRKDFEPSRQPKDSAKSAKAGLGGTAGPPGPGDLDPTGSDDPGGGQNALHQLFASLDEFTKWVIGIIFAALAVICTVAGTSWFESKRWTTVLSDVSKINDDVSCLKNDVSSLKNDVGSLKNDVSSLKENLADLRSTLRADMRENRVIFCIALGVISLVRAKG